MEETKGQVDVVAKIVLPAEQMQSLIMSLINAAFDYEKTFDKEIMPKKDKGQ